MPLNPATPWHAGTQFWVGPKWWALVFKVLMRIPHRYDLAIFCCALDALGACVV